MRTLRKILPLSLTMLFIIIISSSSQLTSSSLNFAMLNQNLLKEESSIDLVSPSIPHSQVGSIIIDGKTTLQTDKDTYAPGEELIVTAESSTDEMNGSLEWQLESPISEVVFDFSSNFQDIFENSTFDDSSIPDWTNVSFDYMEALLGYLNITKVLDDDKDDVEIYYNSTTLTKGKYIFSFDYQVQGENNLTNPGFEIGDKTGWNHTGDPSNVTIEPFSGNASEGTYYASVNATDGFMLNQTVFGWNKSDESRVVIFTLKATGVNATNYWSLRLEAYNSSDKIIGYKDSSIDSQGAIPDEKGYATLIMDWSLPENTTHIKIVFIGHGNDGFYTGWIDDCVLAEMPNDLIFQAWGESGWENRSLTAGHYEWEPYEFEFKIGDNPPADKTIRFILPDDNSFASNATAYWLIDNITINLVTVPSDKTYFITGDKNAGTINSTWFHRGYTETLPSTYDLEEKEPENVTVPIADSYATIKIQLPAHQVYFGSWIFVFMIHQEDSQGDYIDTKTINISFVIKEQMNYVIQETYILRGFTNESNGNFTEYFEQETGIQTLSPGDNVTVLGYLEANSTPSEWYSLDYLIISSAFTEFYWNGTWASREDEIWSISEFIPFNEEGKTILDGNFTAPNNNTQTMALNFKIPLKGIYGNLSSNVSIALDSTNKKGNVGGKTLFVDMPLNLPTVKFKINITDENLPNLPDTNFYLTEDFSGNISVEFLNFNLETIENIKLNFPDRNISSKLDIPMTDIDLTFQIVKDSEYFHIFHYIIIGNSFLWDDEIDPHLPTGDYDFQIRWNTPYKLGVQNQAFLNISELSISVQGVLSVIPPEKTPEIEQGEQKTINFSVQLSNTQGEEITMVSGLSLKGSIIGNESSGYLIVYEEEGVYKIDLSIDLETDPKSYTIDIFILGRDGKIGSIEFSVIEHLIETDDVPPLLTILDIGGFVFFGLASFVFVGLLYWLNKSMK
ncbi:MAG: hypothetical protein ACFE95_03745 [Candidatus Hodarchaeota archaeon]